MHRLILLLFFIFFAQQGYSQCDTLQGEVQWQFWPNINVYYWPNPFEDFYHIDNYPNKGEFVRTVYSISSPTNYDDYYGSQVRGYLRSDIDGQVVFNATGDDTLTLRLSLDNTMANLQVINADTNHIEDLDTIDFVAGQYYYFELDHFERTGWDFARLEWKTSFETGVIDAENWSLVGGQYIYKACDEPCENQGVSCDDGDPNTQNDQWDGNCNCVGDPITANTCVGERGLLQAYLYKNIEGGNTDTLDHVIANNIQPDTVETLGKEFLARYYLTEGADSNYGVFIQGFISVPVTGLYSFNITGSHENHFYISSDETPANKTANHVHIPWWAGTYIHDNPDYEMYTSPENHNQSEENILLEAGRYYYIELRHKSAANNWQQFNLYWKTPYQTSNYWKRIPTFYFFDYTCETFCVKSGTGCNDNDPFTANDQWDGSCNCVGTPCTAPDCDDPTTSFLAAEECETTNLIDNRADDAWLSCAPLSAAPNAARTGQHWIQYDFGGAYNLGTTQVWNYNVDGATASGFQQVVIDYSTDGINWQELGTYNWDLASGTTDYEGFVGPDFTNITARYVLISSMDDPNTCRGIHKIAFNAVSCPRIEFSTPTIDQSLVEQTNISQVNVTITGGEAAINSVALFLDDMWIASDNTAPYEWTDITALQDLANGDYKLSAVATDANGTECELATQIHALALTDFPCESSAIVLDTTEEMVYRTDATITSTGMVESADPTFYVAEESITLMPGFHAVAGSEFTAMIATCTNTLTAPLAQARTSKVTIGTPNVKLYPNPVISNFIVEIEAYEVGQMQIRVFDVLGKELGNLSRQTSINKGITTIDLPAQSLTAGLYYCSIKINDQSFTKSFVRVDRN